ncbi:MAG TPA: SUMF1/EgtB/PvdO family nonheme iron enzyme [Pyrinomonadaceae bacterium]|nr:SUMF1/EgtB/PvdO family nonheme iron enzyme [Pyrinomonadaceae bacterium]
MMKTILLLFLTLSVVFSVPTADPQTSLPTRIVHKPSGITLVLVPAGQFRMGSPENELDRGSGERQHLRLIRKPFYMGETEVTVAQFRRFINATRYLTDAERGTEEGGHHKGAFATVADGERDWSEVANWQNPYPNFKEYCLGDDHPVVQVSWNDAKRFVDHFGLQLPTEAQWEYAMRAGTTTRFFWGDGEADGKGYGNIKDLASKKRFSRWVQSFPFDDGSTFVNVAGSYKPNPWKLHDMVGNVQEWCQDQYVREYPPDGSDETAIENGVGRVMRGGSWFDAPDAQRSAKRFAFAPQGRRDFIGFRVVMKVP